MMVYTLVRVKVRVSEGGTTCLPWVIVKEKLLCFGIMLMIRGYRVKLDRWDEYWVRVWFDS